MMANRCPICDVNMDTMGRMHNCRPKKVFNHDAKVSEEKSDLGKDDAEAASDTGGEAIAGDAAGHTSTYRYRDKEKHRKYMKEYMRKRRMK